MDGESDLFGNPVRQGHGQRGRPPYEPTAKDRNKVKLLLALGWSNTRVANAIDVSPATLKRYFRADLKTRDQMRDRLDARRIEIAAELANAGNVPALKELGKMIEKSDIMRVDRSLREAQGDVEPEERGAKLGKKEAKKAAAKTAGDGSIWGTDLMPGIVN